MKHILPKAVLCIALFATKSPAQGLNSNILWGTGNYSGGGYSATGGVASGTSSAAPYSFAFGYTCETYAAHGIALGHTSKVYGTGGYAQGYTCTANGIWSISLGVLSLSEGYGSFSQGYQSIANGEWSIAMGDQAKAHDLMNRAYGYMSTAGDPDPNINYTHCYAFGSRSIAKHNNTVALGALSQALGEESKAVGLSSVASGKSAVTLGESSTASGDQSTAIGQGSKAIALHSVTAGPFSIARGNPAAWVSSDPVFTVANGQSDTARSNALVVLKSGAVLVKPAGDLSMGSFTAGSKPDDANP